MDENIIKVKKLRLTGEDILVIKGNYQRIREVADELEEEGVIPEGAVIFLLGNDVDMDVVEDMAEVLEQTLMEKWISEVGCDWHENQWN